MDSIDKIDQKILEVLQDDSRLSSRKIAKKAGLPITTVYNRIKKLEQDGIIKKFSIVLDYEKLGLDVLAYILIKCDLTYLRKKDTNPIINIVKKMPGVEEVNSVTGSTDLILKVRANSINQLMDVLINKIREIPGIQSTETILVLKQH